MNVMSRFFKSLAGPRLYYTIRESHEDPECKDIISYSSNQSPVEWFSDLILVAFEWAYTIIKYVSPFIAISLCRDGCESSYVKWLTKSRMACIAAVFFGSHIARGLARCMNADYIAFIDDVSTKMNSTTLFRKYDFDPVNVEPALESKTACKLKNVDASVLGWPLFGFIYTWIARPLAYPGSTFPLNRLMRLQLDNGRLYNFMSKENTYRTYRAIVKTVDGNRIDTMFLDRRKGHENGETLVITSEGNAGYYELGCFDTAQKHGYSTLGWNHPGFAKSTGKPSDVTDANAILAVYEYAVDELKFPPGQIMLYGWSIGGFPTCYLASRKPDIGGVILDATFSDIKTLARSRMPESIGGLVNAIAERYFNLDNAHYLVQYPGPLRFIRRSRDEVIGDDPGRPETNHGNALVKTVLLKRYPEIVDNEVVQGALDNWLAVDNPSERKRILGGYDEKKYEQIMKDYNDSKESNRDPNDCVRKLSEDDKIRLAYYIFDKMFDDCNNGHNGMLSRSLFRKPWSPASDKTV